MEECRCKLQKERKSADGKTVYYWCKFFDQKCECRGAENKCPTALTLDTLD